MRVLESVRDMLAATCGKEREAAERKIAAAMGTYRSILLSDEGGELDGARQAELTDAVKALGLTEAEVEGDILAATEVRELSAQVTSREAIGELERVQAAQLKECDVERARLFTLEPASAEAKGVMERAKRNNIALRGAIEALRAKTPRLYRR